MVGLSVFANQFVLLVKNLQDTMDTSEKYRGILCVFFLKAILLGLFAVQSFTPGSHVFLT